jgi:NADPH:quinone reductase-like Zn-dependent oxidoreductase
LTSFAGLASIEVGDVQEPTVDAGQVLVDIAAATLGPWDLAAASGAFSGAGGSTDFPQVQGWDFAGTIAAGSASSDLPAGTAVVGFTPQPWSRTGAFAERIAVPIESVSRVPDGVDFADVATLPVSALTAHLLLATADAQAGESVLIIGAAGAVGGVTAQLASHRGLVVLGSADPNDHARLRGLGVGHVVDRNGDVAAQARAVRSDGVDIVIDLVGGVAANDALAAVRDGGRFVSSIPVPPPSGRGIRSTNVAVSPDKATLDNLLRQLAEHDVTPVPIVAHFPLEDARDAYARLARGGVKGKILLNTR